MARFQEQSQDNIATKQPARDNIARQTAEFLAKGGVIDVRENKSEYVVNTTVDSRDY